MWPTSAAAPNAPRMSSPARTTPPPRPVPTVRVTVKGWPWPAPKRVSAQAAALASFSTTTGSPVRCSIAARSGSLRQARLGANSTVERAASTNPAAPEPGRLDLVVGGQLADAVGDEVLGLGRVLGRGVAS